MEESEKKTEKKPVCTMCGKPSESVICHSCEDRLRAEALEHKRDVEKAGKVGTGRR